MKKRAIHAMFLLVFASGSLHAQNAVKTHEGVKIGGIRQWIGAQSGDASKPLLLFLHGGPGFSSRAYSKKFVEHLTRDFIVAQWDQRGTGITAAWGGATDSLTLPLMHRDTREVVNYLLKKFDKQKLYLVGFSWGGFLGLHFANEHPELLHAYVSVSAVIHGNESERVTLDLLRDHASKSNNAEALEELAKITVPFTSWEELYYQRKWTAFFSGRESDTRAYPKALFREWSQKWMPIFLEASRVNYAETVPALRCPVYFFLSNRDAVANHTVTQRYVDHLTAPEKQVVWFARSTHEIPSQEPKRFALELIKISRSSK